MFCVFFKVVWMIISVFQCFKDVSSVFWRSCMDISRVLQRYWKKKFQSVPRKFQGCFRDISTMCQDCLKGPTRKFPGKPDIPRMFQLSFVSQFCCCVADIAASRAEGGLLHLSLIFSIYFLISLFTIKPIFSKFSFSFIL